MINNIGTIITTAVMILALAWAAFWGLHGLGGFLADFFGMFGWVARGLSALLWAMVFASIIGVFSFTLAPIYYAVPAIIGAVLGVFYLPFRWLRSIVNWLWTRFWALSIRMRVLFGIVIPFAIILVVVIVIM